ncbi:hypothetical protein E2C01_017296 [Portunus trituberculatus]|uniref:Uncharacterized protein n=1 Tax=Portunus trituberculatus TaxID=210409 RepID=A0A5B7DS43_PORTR|nr:hypothetical protein [Portunus trituberculatus]
MLLQVTAVAAAVGTTRADVRLLSRVGAQVGLQMVTAADAASTDGTDHWPPTKHPPTVHLRGRPLQRDPTASLARLIQKAARALGNSHLDCEPNCLAGAKPQCTLLQPHNKSLCLPVSAGDVQPHAIASGAAVRTVRALVPLLARVIGLDAGVRTQATLQGSLTRVNHEVLTQVVGVPRQQPALPTPKPQRRLTPLGRQHVDNCCANTVISYIFMVNSLLRPGQWHPMKTMPALHVAFYIPLKEAAKRTIGALMRFLPGVDAHVPPEVISSTAGPTTNWTTQLSTLLTPRLSQRATQWLTHQHSPCFFQLQRNSLHQLSIRVSHHNLAQNRQVTRMFPSRAF